MTQPSSGHREPRGRDLLVLALAAVLFLGFALGERDLWNPNEPTYGRIVAEMSESTDWLAPQLNGIPFYEKPLLYFWMGAAAAKAIGVSETSVRLPVFACAVASTLLVFLLIHGYEGRRRAWIGAACFATVYSVWFNARNAQMDSFVLFGTLAVLVPLCRRLDGEWSGRKAWLWAGVGAAIGFAGKGPVSLAVPGLILVVYLIVGRRPWRRLLPGLPLGLAAFVLLATPGYLLLFVRGGSEALHEMFIRQNFSRFVDAWDHDQPWWYYLKYFWVTFLPWSWLVPAAAIDDWRRRREGDGENGRLLRWVWLLAPLVFFSLSDSKREPYMLPAAPAVAWLAAAVTDRFAGGRLGRGATVAVLVAVALLGVVFAAGAVGVPRVEELPSGVSVPLTSGVLIVAAAALLLPLASATHRRRSPLALLGVIAAIYTLIALHLHPAVDEIKSARGLATSMRAEVDGDTELFSFLPEHAHIRGGYSFYLDRAIPNEEDENALRSRWAAAVRPCVLYENSAYDPLFSTLSGARRRLTSQVGSREVRLVCKDAS